jgi:hypothetical protein
LRATDPLAALLATFGIEPAGLAPRKKKRRRRDPDRYMRRDQAHREKRGPVDPGRLAAWRKARGVVAAHQAAEASARRRAELVGRRQRAYRADVVQRERMLDAWRERNLWKVRDAADAAAHRARTEAVPIARQTQLVYPDGRGGYRPGPIVR